MRNTTRGFTLIELLIVLSIVGVLGAIAVPTYVDHVSRSQMTRAYAELSVYARAAELLIADSRASEIAAANGDAVGFVDSSITSVTFGTFADETSSTITATMDDAASSAVTGVTIELSRAHSGAWTCTVTGSSSGWKDRFRPEQCR